MPSFRGIEISICTREGSHSNCNDKLPEYPHPEGSSVCLGGVVLVPKNSLHDHTSGSSRRPSATSPTPTDVDDPFRQRKIDPRISVYVPSSSGQPFWLGWSINQSPPPSKYIFFKLFMNGRHIISWGVDPDICSRGRIDKALYEPGKRWRAIVNGVEVPVGGAEARYFHFMFGLDDKSAAEDGGLIEVNVFRCKGRKRTRRKLDEYRNQEHYGILAPTGGLVSDVRDNGFYKYHLSDAKDSPYATFGFHYRSMRHLQNLNLIPSRDLGPRSMPFRPYNGSSIFSHPTPSAEIQSSSSQRFGFYIGSAHEEDFDSANAPTRYTNRIPVEPRRRNQEYSSRGYLMPIVPSRPDTFAVELQELPRDSRNDIFQRPLPELPQRRIRRPSGSSFRSECPSLTPSLMQYVESDEFEDEEIRLSTAQPLLIPSESMRALPCDNASGDNESVSDYAMSPSPTETTQIMRLPSPDGYVPLIGSALELYISDHKSPIGQSSPLKARTAGYTSGGEISSLRDTDTSRTSPLTLTESEWMRHSPSPLRQSTQTAGHCHNPKQQSRLDESLHDGIRYGLNAIRSPGQCGDIIGGDDEAPVGNWV